MLTYMALPRTVFVLYLGYCKGPWHVINYRDITGFCLFGWFVFFLGGGLFVCLFVLQDITKKGQRNLVDMFQCLTM